MDYKLIPIMGKKKRWERGREEEGKEEGREGKGKKQRSSERMGDRKHTSGTYAWEKNWKTVC